MLSHELSDAAVDVAFWLVIEVKENLSHLRTKLTVDAASLLFQARVETAKFGGQFRRRLLALLIHIN